MKLLNIFNWVQSLVESFTFYGGSSSGGGGAMGGAFRSAMGNVKPSNLTSPTFGGRPPGMPQSQTMNFGDGRFPQGMPPMPQGLPPMQSGMNQPQGLPMQGGSFAGGGRPFNPQANQNIPYLMNFGGNRPPQGMPASQGQPEGRPFNPQALQNNPYLINNKMPPNFTSQGMGLPAQQPRDFMSLIGGGKPYTPTF
jgi:hypothetical protein